jgi:hypothetical protein
MPAAAAHVPAAPVEAAGGAQTAATSSRLAVADPNGVDTVNVSMPPTGAAVTVAAYVPSPRSDTPESRAAPSLVKITPVTPLSGCPLPSVMVATAVVVEAPSAGSAG